MPPKTQRTPMDLASEEASLLATLQLLKKHEGFRGKVYDDKTGITVGRLPSGGWPTVGYGVNLSLDELTEKEGEFLLKNRVSLIFLWLDAKFPWFSDLGAGRKAVVASMVYNMGKGNFLEFKRLIKALSMRDHVAAGEEITNSDAARKLPQRYAELKRIMWTGR